MISIHSIYINKQEYGITKIKAYKMKCQNWKATSFHHTERATFNRGFFCKHTWWEIKKETFFGKATEPTDPYNFADKCFSLSVTRYEQSSCGKCVKETTHPHLRLIIRTVLSLIIVAMSIWQFSITSTLSNPIGWISLGWPVCVIWYLTSSKFLFDLQMDCIHYEHT